MFKQVKELEGAGESPRFAWSLEGEFAFEPPVFISVKFEREPHDATVRAVGL